MSLALTPQPRIVATLRSLAALAVVTAAAACSDGAGVREDNAATVSFAVASPTAAITSDALVTSDIVVSNGRTVDLQSADVVFDDITFSGKGVSDENNDDIDDDDDDFDDDDDLDDEDEADEVRFRAGAATVSLPLEGGMITPFSGALPQGTFTRLSMKAQFVRLRGTVDGQPFDVTVPVNSKLKVLIDPPLVVGTSSVPANVSVNIDVASWLKDRNGSVIDPRQLTTDPQLRREFRQRVRESFHAFKDHDRDGRDHDENDDDHDN